MPYSLLFWMTTCWSYILAFVPFIVNWALQIFYQETESESHLRRQIADLKAELATVSMVDEFAKHAKIQRKIIKVTTELTNQSELQTDNLRSTLRMKVKFAANLVLYTLSGIVILYLIWQYGSEQVLEVRPQWIYPLDSLILTNVNETYGLSARCWLFISGVVAKVVSRTFV